MADQAPVLYGKYQLLERLARGGMAEVWKAKSHGVEGFEKVLVIKRILPELGENPSFVTMFIDEAKIAVTLSHANIVQVFDLGRADDTYFIAMEYVAGTDLATLLEQGRALGRRLPPALAVYVASEVAKGLDYAHRRRDAQMRPLAIVHRDVSPQNVLLSYEGEVKLTDFGIARARTMARHHSEVGVLKGKYAYMAPEQAQDAAVDNRTDIFALGTVLYEALTGDNPFAGTSAYETLKLVRVGKVPPLRNRAAGLEEELEAIVARAMEPLPADRYPNAGQLYEDLIQYLYASGQRAGAHDLATYMDEIRTLRAEGSRDQAASQAWFDLSDRVNYAGPDATPVEVPSARTPAGTPGGRRRRTRSSITLPNAEKRDVTALALRAAEDEPLHEATIRELLRRFGGGLVEQRLGEDGEGRSFVALFGVRDPDGHDTEDAARCALRIARAAAAAALDRGGTTVQIAVHAGRVLLDLSGELIRDERYEKLVRTAREHAAQAHYGRVLVTPDAETSIRALFELAVDPEGTEGTFSIVSERAEAPGKFVGRRSELKAIGDLLAQANRGSQSVLVLVGETGAGKTRLLTEMRRRLRLGGHDVGMTIAHLTRRNRDVPLSACQDMLRAILGIDEFDPEPLIREKTARLRELGLPRPEMAAVETMLGISTESEPGPASDRPVRAAFGHIAQKLAEDRLTILAFDGAESMDPESVALIHRLLSDARQGRVLVALATRPGVTPWWDDVRSRLEVEVGPLSDEDVGRLIESRLSASALPEELVREVASKSGGNPLYVEEYLKALRDARAIELENSQVLYRQDVAAVDVPKTLRGIVGARLALLETRARHVLQVASIVGGRFGAGVLARVANIPEEAVEELLDGLERKGLVRHHGPSECALVHDLVGEVLREGLPLDSRRELHEAVATALEEEHPTHVEEMAERLAYHYREGKNLPKAVEYLIRAADRLESEHALPGAIASLVRALELLAQLPAPDRDQMLALHRRLGDLSFRARDLEAGAERMIAALDLADGLGRVDYVARFAMMRGRLLANANRLAEARKWLDRAHTVAREHGNVELLRDVTLATAEAATRSGEFGRAIALLQEVLELSEETSDVQAQIRCVIPLAYAYGAHGNRELAFATLRKAHGMVERSVDRYTECELHKMASLVHLFFGERRKALETALHALELAKEYGFAYESAVNAHNVGEMYLQLGDYKRAFANLRYSHEIAQEHGYVKLQYTNMRVLGFIDAIKFGSEEGRMRIVDAARYAEQHGFIWDLVQAKYMLAVTDQRRGDDETAQNGFRQVLRLSAEYGNLHYEEDARRALDSMAAGVPVPVPGERHHASSS